MANNLNKNKVIEVTGTTDVETINSHKVVCQSIEIPDIVEGNGGTCLLKSLALVDETSTGMVCDIIFTGLATAIAQDEGKSVGEDVDDLDGIISKMIGHVSIVAGDYTDLFDAKMATKTGID